MGEIYSKKFGKIPNFSENGPEDFPFHRIETTVIGSYPFTPNRFKIMNDYFNCQTKDYWKEGIKSAVEDMVNAGINIVSDGQIKDSFVQLFMRKFNGVRIRGRAEIVNKIEYLQPIIVEDVKFARSIIPKSVKLKVPITGAYTLFSSSINYFYNDEKEAVFDIAEILNKEAKNLAKIADIISIDEPFFANSFPEYGKEIIEKVVSNVDSQFSLHVCGDVSEIIPNLIEMPVDFLCHEFKATPELFSAFEDYSFSQGLTLGSVRSDKMRVESVSEIAGHIEKGLKVFGEKIKRVSPDCGLRNLTRDVAFVKLENLSKAVRNINER